MEKNSNYEGNGLDLDLTEKSDVQQIDAVSTFDAMLYTLTDEFSEPSKNIIGSSSSHPLPEKKALSLDLLNCIKLEALLNESSLGLAEKLYGKEQVTEYRRIRQWILKAYKNGLTKAEMLAMCASKNTPPEIFNIVSSSMETISRKLKRDRAEYRSPIARTPKPSAKTKYQISENLGDANQIPKDGMYYKKLLLNAVHNKIAQGADLTTLYEFIHQEKKTYPIPILLTNFDRTQIKIAVREARKKAMNNDDSFTH